MLDELFQGEQRINQMEVDIEEECLKILALYQPVATGLRFIVAVLKVNNDLERMGDQAINIAGRVKFLMGREALKAPVDFPAMGEVAGRMVHLSLQALVDQDVDLVRRVGEMDDKLDDMHAESYRIVEAVMAQDTSIIPTAVSYLTISANLERVGDLSLPILQRKPCSWKKAASSVTPMRWITPDLSSLGGEIDYRAQSMLIVLKCQAAIVQRGNGGNQIEAQAVARCTAGLFQTNETTHYTLPVLCADTRTIVADNEVHAVTVVLE